METKLLCHITQVGLFFRKIVLYIGSPTASDEIHKKLSKVFEVGLITPTHVYCFR